MPGIRHRAAVLTASGCSKEAVVLSLTVVMVVMAAVIMPVMIVIVMVMMMAAVIIIIVIVVMVPAAAVVMVIVIAVVMVVAAALVIIIVILAVAVRMGVAVLELLSGRLADLIYGDVEVEVHAGKRMVHVDGYVISVDLHYNGGLHALIGLKAVGGADLGLEPLEERALHGADLVCVPRAVGLLRGEPDAELLACLTALELLLEAVQEPPGTVHVDKILARGLVEDIPRVILQHIGNGNNALALNFHM